jgi:hypothetical protein
VTGAQIRARLEVLVSVLSEVVYQRVRYLLAAAYPPAHVAAAAAAETTLLLQLSVDGDGDVDGDDAVRFDLRRDPAALFRESRLFESLAGGLLDGEPPTAFAFAISDPSLGYVDLPQGTSLDVDVAGEVVYLAGGTVGLQLYQRRGTLLRVFNTPDSAEAVQVVGRFAYVADRTSLLIVDVDSPEFPVLAGQVTLAGASRLHVVGNRAYVLDPNVSTPALRVVDVADPANPVVRGAIATQLAGDSIVSDGSHAYVGFGARFVQVFDVRDPAAPLSLGTFSTLRDTLGMVLHGGHLCVATLDGLEVFERADPAQPTRVGFLPLHVGPAGDLVSFGARLALASNAGLLLVDMTDPTAPVLLGSLPGLGALRHVAFGSGHLVAADADGGFEVFAAGTPPPSAVVGSVAVANSLSGLDAVPGRAWVGSRVPDALFDLDISDPEQPVVLGQAPLTFGSRDVRVIGDRAYVATNGLSVLDVSVPGAPVHLGTTRASSTLFAVDAGTDIAWSVNNSDRLAVWDVSDPTDPDLLTTVTNATNPHDVAFDGERALVVADGSGGFHAYDVTDPSNPTPRVAVLINGSPVRIAARPGLAFLTVAQLLPPFLGNLRIFDIRTLTAPQFLSFVGLTGTNLTLDLEGDQAFVGANLSGVHVIDISDPAAPFRWATLPVPGEVREIAAAGPSVVVVGRGEVSVLRAPVRPVP